MSNVGMPVRRHFTVELVFRPQTPRGVFRSQRRQLHGVPWGITEDSLSPACWISGLLLLNLQLRALGPSGEPTRGNG